MSDGSPIDHRRRYRALDDLRRLGFEQERLWFRLQGHPDWPTRPLTQRRAIEASLDTSLASTGGVAHSAAPVRQSTQVRLDAEVRFATHRLVLLAKALRALETGTPLPDPATDGPATV